MWNYFHVSVDNIFINLIGAIPIIYICLILQSRRIRRKEVFYASFNYSYIHMNMDSRREFIKKAAILAGATGIAGVLPPSIQRALAIDPATGTTWLDAEHVVILMQENRSFDHCYGSLRGVRGYQDPRFMRLPNGNPVWLQTNDAGETYAPFRLDIKDTKATWMGSLPHSWTNQHDARNEGRYDKWLQAKHSSTKEYAHMPLTMGFYDRRDIPFYYALADAFTVCDQNFCSSLTGTTPNRLHLWTGTIRDAQDPNVRARVRNEDTDYPVEANWTTFPERLEDAGISWKIYQNEVSLCLDFEGEQDSWLSNFGDNPLEWFSQYHIRYTPVYMPLLGKKIDSLTKEIAEAQQKINALPEGSEGRKDAERELAEKQGYLKMLQADQARITPENYEKIPQREKNLHEKAFTRNSKDPHFHGLDELEYKDGDATHKMKAPRGDVFHQFREDVKSGQLPTVSWLVSPENFSDHPSAPWYGAWYVSEAMDILTSNPEVWKKTIFILCYDENDGYYDHVSPFTAPDPNKPETGKVSEGVDAALEWVSREQDLQRSTEEEARAGSIGLGFRVPLVIASPWSRGGYVNSQVFDHTSILQLLENWLTHRTGKTIKETNINSWRRTVCGDLSSVFRPYKGEKVELPLFLEKDAVLEGINKAKYRHLPTGFKQLTAADIAEFRQNPFLSQLMPRQEKGVRVSCAIPYELYTEGFLKEDGSAVHVQLRVGNTVFGDRSVGSPFTIYSYGQEFKTRNYAVRAGDQLSDEFPLADFENGHYTLEVHGPNGYFRAFRGSKEGPSVGVELGYEGVDSRKPTGRVQLKLTNSDKNHSYTVIIKDNAYKSTGSRQVLGAAGTGKEAAVLTVDTASGSRWYDLSVTIEGDGGAALFERRYAGRVETGTDGISDPAMGHAI